MLKGEGVINISISLKQFANSSLMDKKQSDSSLRFTPISLH